MSEPATRASLLLFFVIFLPSGANRGIVFAHANFPCYFEPKTGHRDLILACQISMGS